MGDFNDYPSNKSVFSVLRAKDNRIFRNGNLYNMAYALDKDNKGTYNYKGDWGNVGSNDYQSWNFSSRCRS